MNISLCSTAGKSSKKPFSLSKAAPINGLPTLYPNPDTKRPDNMEVPDLCMPSTMNPSRRDMDTSPSVLISFSACCRGCCCCSFFCSFLISSTRSTSIPAISSIPAIPSCSSTASRFLARFFTLCPGESLPAPSLSACAGGFTSTWDIASSSGWRFLFWRPNSSSGKSSPIIFNAPDLCNSRSESTRSVRRCFLLRSRSVLNSPTASSTSCP
mmetsp:Transcript_1138/g.2539  ORF Transcript_1138/g.2539 Transcript_1138/m.2539 type:complete len:212 (+) Transcript_1138:715-1350(+)